MGYWIKQLRTACAAAILMGVGAATASAATYSTFTGGDPSDGLDFQGTFPTALDLETDAVGPALVIGNAAFEKLYDAANAPAGVVTGGPPASYFQAGGAYNFGGSVDDDALEAVMDTTWATGAVPEGGFTISLSIGASGTRLIAGQQYKLQVFGLANPNPSFPRELQLFAEGQSLGVFDFQSPDITTTGGVVTHEFTAADTFLGDNLYSVAFIYPGNPSTNQAFIGGLTIEAVPEPTCLSLLGLGGLSLLRRRRA